MKREEGEGTRLGLEDHRALVLWATDCAERVLRYFEEEYPEDDRPRRAVAAGQAWARGETGVTEVRAAAFAAHAAAREVNQDAARAAARAAGGHAAATAHVAGHATHAASYALAAVSYAAPTTATRERAWQSRNLPERLWPVALPD